MLTTAMRQSAQDWKSVATLARRPHLQRAAEQILLGAFPLVLTVALAFLYLHRGTFAEDAHVWYWPAAWRVDHGLSPYALPANLAINYPAVGALIIAPLGVVSHSI